MARYANINIKCVTLTSEVVSAMQINRIAKQNGLQNLVKAFNSDLTNEVKEFLNK